MKIATNGITRVVFVFSEVVVKIPNFRYSWRHFLQGLLANISEKEIWVLATTDGCDLYAHRHCLCPVLWCSWGGWILVMEKAQTLTDEEWDTIDVDIREHKEWFAGDDKVCNYGLLDNRIVKIDYAQ